MKFLDLFCCCGGISQGIKNALPDTEITGVDKTDGHDYPFNFIQADVFDLDLKFFEQFDLIHASPPCQEYSTGTKWIRNKGNHYTDLLEETRNLLIKIGKPFTIENVIGAPIRRDLMLCGVMFGMRIVRHRLFEIHGFSVPQPKHFKHKNAYRKENKFSRWYGDKIGNKNLKHHESYYIEVSGHGGNSSTFKFDFWKAAMGINWITKRTHLTQMIPPKYYEFIVRNAQKI